jgi:hypothetical protein
METEVFFPDLCTLYSPKWKNTKCKMTPHQKTYLQRKTDFICYIYFIQLLQTNVCKIIKRWKHVHHLLIQIPSLWFWSLQPSSIFTEQSHSFHHSYLLPHHSLNLWYLSTSLHCITTQNNTSSLPPRDPQISHTVEKLLDK